MRRDHLVEGEEWDGRSLGKGGGMMVLLAARAPASEVRARVGEVRLRVDFNR